MNVQVVLLGGPCDGRTLDFCLKTTSIPSSYIANTYFSGRLEKDTFVTITKQFKESERPVYWLAGYFGHKAWYIWDKATNTEADILHAQQQEEES